MESSSSGVSDLHESTQELEMRHKAFGEPILEHATHTLYFLVDMLLGDTVNYVSIPDMDADPGLLQGFAPQGHTLQKGRIGHTIGIAML